MRLIDADKGLISKIQRETGCNFITAQKIVDSMPTVEERKVGKWIDGHCTNCGCDVPAYINDWKWEKDMNAKWCPQCGAEMRGNENDTKTSYKGI